MFEDTPIEKNLGVQGALLELPAPQEAALITAKPPRFYAILFELCGEALISHYPGTSWNKAYGEIKAILEKYGFVWQQGNLYFGKPEVDSVTCVLAAVECSHSLPWFKSCVQSMTMLRIEEKSDLLPAVRGAEHS